MKLSIGDKVKTEDGLGIVVEFDKNEYGARDVCVHISYGNTMTTGRSFWYESREVVKVEDKSFSEIWK